MTRHTSLAVLTRLDSMLSTFCPLRAQLEFDDESIEMLGYGDDGVVLRWKRPGDSKIAVKTFKQQPRRVNPFIDTHLAQFAQDQAQRELSGLTLAAGHPCIPTVNSTELDTCTVKVRGQSPYPAWAVQMQLVNRLKPIDDAIYGIGITKTGDLDASQFGAVIKHISAQLFSVLNHLHTHKIRHRDLDYTNVQVRKSDMHVFILDFARADLPGLTCPNTFLEQWIETPQKPPTSLTQDKTTASVQDRNTVRDFVKRAYMVPYTLNKEEEIRRDYEPTDYAMLRQLVQRNLTLPDDIPKYGQAFHFKMRLDSFISGMWPAYHEPMDYESFLNHSEALCRDNTHMDAVQSAIKNHNRVSASSEVINAESADDIINQDWNAGECDFPFINHYLQEVISILDSLRDKGQDNSSPFHKQRRQLIEYCNYVQDNIFEGAFRIENAERVFNDTTEFIETHKWQMSATEKANILLSCHHMLRLANRNLYDT